MVTTSLPAPVAVLDSAVTWTHGCLQLARGVPMNVPTPCADWDLGDLLLHMEDSLLALSEAADLGQVVVAHGRRGDLDRTIDQIITLACTTTAAWRRRLTSAPIGVGDLGLGRDTLALVGALEIATHGWDVAVATGDPRPLPEDLAHRLYDVALAVVTPEERGRRFATVVHVPSGATTGTRLLAHLGRRAPDHH